MKVSMAPRGICASMDGKQKDDNGKTTGRAGIKENQSKELQGGRANASVQFRRGERKVEENNPFHL